MTDVRRGGLRDIILQHRQNHCDEIWGRCETGGCHHQLQYKT